MDQRVQILGNDEVKSYDSEFISCGRRWLDYRIKIFLTRLDEYTIELKLMTYINGERRCIRIIPSCSKLIRLFNIINDMIPVIVNKHIENDVLFPNDCQSVHILVSQPVVKLTEINEKLASSSEKTDISDGSFSIASQFPDHLSTYILPHTTLRRISKVVSSRYLLILLVQKIEEMLEILPDDANEIVSFSQNMPIQIEAFKMWHSERQCGYQLLDGSLGLAFSDRTNLILLSNFRELYFVDKCGNARYFYDEHHCPRFLQSKLSSLAELKSVATKYDDQLDDGRRSYDISYLIRWMRGVHSTILYFNNGRLEIVFDVGKKLIFSPFAKPICVTAKRKPAQVTKLDCKFAAEVCNVLIQKYFKHGISSLYF